MDFRNRKSAANKSINKSTNKANKKFVKVSEVKGVVQIDDGAMWLKSGKYEAPSVSINVSQDVMLSDWVRKITLCNVELSVIENDRGYPELIISGPSETADQGDLPF